MKHMLIVMAMRSVLLLILGLGIGFVVGSSNHLLQSAAGLSLVGLACGFAGMWVGFLYFWEKRMEERR